MKERAIVLVVASAVFANNLAAAMSCTRILGCVHSYWAEFWLLSYSDGFERRAFLGSLMRAATGNEIPFQILNVVCIILASVALLLVTRSIWTLAGPRAALMAGALMLGPSMGLLFETLGDPLHAAFIITAVCAVFPGRTGAILSLAAIPVVVLIHEAAVFLYVPALLVTAYARTGRSPSFPSVAGLVAVISLIVLLFSEQPEFVPSAQFSIADGQFVTANPAILPGYMELLRQETTARFGSIAAITSTFESLARSFLWPSLFVIGLSAIRGDAIPLRTFACLVGLSLPLYLIAHDWGRFAIHTLFATLVSMQSGKQMHFGPAEAHLTGLLNKFVARLQRRVTPEILIAASFLYISHSLYRLEGVTRGNLVVVVALIGFLLVVQNALRRSEEATNCDTGRSSND